MADSPIRRILPAVGNAVTPTAPPGTYWNGVAFVPTFPNMGSYGWAAVQCPPGSPPDANCMGPLPPPDQPKDPPTCLDADGNPVQCPPPGDGGGGVGTGGDPGGSVGGSPGGGDCTQGICDCITASQSDISTALSDIATALQQQSQFSCDQVTGCIDEIIQALMDNLTVPAKTADECAADAAAGLAGTLEYALACAGVQQPYTSPTEPPPPPPPPCVTGETCDTCGCAPCECQDGQCVSIDLSTCQPTEATYEGWCNTDTGETAAGESGKLSYGPPWESTGDYSSLDDAQSAAEGMCPQTTHPTRLDDPVNPISGPGTFCSAVDYVNGNALAALQDSAKQFFQQVNSTKLASRWADIGVFNITAGNIVDLINELAGSWFGTPPHIVEAYMPNMLTAIGCNNDQGKLSIEMIAGMDIISKFTGVDIKKWLTPYEYAINAGCRHKHLEPTHATMEYLANAITYDDLDANFAIHGICHEAIDPHILASQSKPIPEQLLHARWRSVITEQEYNAGMRQLGYVQQRNIDIIYNSSFTIPGLAQIVDFETTQVEVEETATQLELDDGLDQFKQGLTGQWLASHGCQDDLIKSMWREHWVSPPLSMLIELWHRLRNDPGFNGNDELQEDIHTELQRQGISPHWINAYEELLLHPLQRRDAQRAYQYGVIDSDAMQQSFEMQGYTDDAVTALVKLGDKLQVDHLKNHDAIRQWTSWIIDGQKCANLIQQDGYSAEVAAQAMQNAEHAFQHSTQVEAFQRGLLNAGLLTAILTGQGVTAAAASAIVNQASIKLVDHPSIKAYSAGTISGRAASAAMIREGMNPDIVLMIIRNIDADIAAQQAIACQMGTKKQYMTGEFNAAQANANLVQYGIDAVRANLLVANWTCEKSATGKPVLAAELCNWMQEGLITQGDFVNRLITLGYSEVNAQLILGSCLIAFNKKQVKQAQQQAKQAEQQAKQEAQQAAKAQAAIDRQNKQLAAARAKNAKIRSGRDRMMIAAGEQLYLKTGADLVDSIHKVKEMVDFTQSEHGLSLDESLQLVTVASEKFNGADLDAFTADVQTIAAEAADSGNAPPDPVQPSSPSSNGSTQPS
jgi:hypothetical protein